MSCRTGMSALLGTCTSLGRRRSWSPWSLIQMWALIATAFLPCLATLLFVTQWDMGLFLLQGQAAAHWQGLWASSKVFSQWCFLSTNKGCADTRRAPFLSDRNQNASTLSVCMRQTRKRTTQKPELQKSLIWVTWGSWLWPLTSAALPLNPLRSEQPPQMLLGSTTHFRHFKMTLMLRVTVSLTSSQCQTKNFLCWISCQIHGSSFPLLFLLNNIPAFYAALHVKSNVGMPYISYGVSRGVWEGFLTEKQQ